MVTRGRLMFLISLMILFAIAGGTYWWHTHSQSPTTTNAYKTTAESNPYVRFVMEGYDTIQAHYWQTATDADLSALFQLSLAKALATSSITLATTTRAGTAQMIAHAFTSLATTTQHDIAVQTLTIVLFNLGPTGRNNLLSSQAQAALQNTVNNVDPSNNPYESLGIAKDADARTIEKAYETQRAVLAATTSPEGKAKATEVEQAHKVLTTPINKTIYDERGAQPTVFSHHIGAHTLYIDISSIAPTTINEAIEAIIAASSTPSLSNLIIDVRGNIGGDLTFTQNFMSLFLGPNQYAFDLFHQGIRDVQRTPPSPIMPELARYREIAILTDSMTQSTAELTASAMKQYHLAHIVGLPTRAWGSVEQVLPMQTVINPSETYAIELVVYLTLRYDGLPVESNGVLPDVNVGDTQWKSQLPTFFSSPDMLRAIESTVTRSPMQ